MATLVTDTFVEAGDTPLANHTPELNVPGNSWVEDWGGWTVGGGLGRVNPSGAGPGFPGYVATIDVADTETVTDYLLEIFANFTAPGPAFRFVDKDNLWFVRLQSNTGIVTLMKREAGNETPEGSWDSGNGTISTGTNHAVTLTLSGDVITVDIVLGSGAGTGQISISNAFNASATKLGLFGDSSGNRFYTINVEQGVPSASPPANTAPPVVNGVTAVGSWMTTTDGTWTGDPTPTYSYQWRSGTQVGGGDMSDIVGATENFYLLTESEQTLYVRCVVTGTNSEAPAGVPANSNIEGPVTEFPGAVTPPMTGLIGKWFPSQDTAGNETGTLFDLSTRSNHGVLTGTNWVADTASGGIRAIEFDSPGDGVACPNPTMGDVFTISLWVYLNSSKQGTWQPFVNQWESGVTGRFLFMYENATDSIFVSLGTSENGNPISILDGWHHIAFTRDGSRWRWWVDGVLNRDEYDESSGQTAQVPMEIGNYLGDQFDGRIDSVLVFDNVVPDEDIEFLATSRAADEQGTPPSAPSNTDAPVVTGIEAVASTLSTTDGTWDGNPEPTYSYQWQSGIQAGGGDMTNIAGAIADTYLLTASEETLYIRCIVTGTNSEAPAGVPANSAIVGPVISSLDVALQSKWSPSLDTSGNGTGTLFDLEGNSDGAITGAEWTLDPGSGGIRSLVFNGSSDFVEMPNIPAQPADLSITWSAWVKLSATGSYPMILTYGDVGGGAKDVNLRFSDNVRQPEWLIGGSGNVVALSPDPLSIGEWHLLVGVMEAGVSGRIYVDGVLKNTDSSVGGGFRGFTGSDPFFMGRRTDGFYFPGSIDTTRYWTRAITDQEIIDLFNMGRSEGGAVIPTFEPWFATHATQLA